MAISRNYPGSLELSELQAILDQDESGFGPIEGLEIFGNGPSALTTIVYDDAIELDAPMSILAASEKPPAGRIAYVRGQIQVGGTTRDITSFVLKRERLQVLARSALGANHREQEVNFRPVDGLEFHPFRNDEERRPLLVEVGERSVGDGHAVSDPR